VTKGVTRKIGEYLGESGPLITHIPVVCDTEHISLKSEVSVHCNLFCLLTIQ
jgi:hypothetical protein